MAPIRGTDPLMPPGVTHSNEVARVPPLSDACLAENLDEAFTAETNAVVMADSAMAYQNLAVGRHGCVGQCNGLA